MASSEQTTTTDHVKVATDTNVTVSTVPNMQAVTSSSIGSSPGTEGGTEDNRTSADDNGTSAETPKSVEIEMAGSDESVSL